jgi:hypothetical protein
MIDLALENPAKATILEPYTAAFGDIQIKILWDYRGQFK